MEGNTCLGASSNPGKPSIQEKLSGEGGGDAGGGRRIKHPVLQCPSLLFSMSFDLPSEPRGFSIRRMNDWTAIPPKDFLASSPEALVMNPGSVFPFNGLVKMFSFILPTPVMGDESEKNNRRILYIPGNKAEIQNPSRYIRCARADCPA